MNKITNYTTLLLSSLLLTVSSVQASEHPTTETHIKHWGYTADVGPSHWSELNKQYNMCSEGKSQSPINIVATSDVNLSALDLNYTTASTSVIDNGHSVQVNIASGSTFTIGTDKYELKQFHFHTPSENNINAKSFPLEAHFVHATADGKLAVVAVMFEEGKENAILSKIWGKFPLKRGEKTDFNLTSEDVNTLMPKDKDYYKFTGSLTTPPCSEEVKWHVIKKPQTVSKEQVKQFFDIYGHTNNRPIQDTNKRNIIE